MLRHPDPEVQFLVQMLEGQRDVAVSTASSLYKENMQLKEQLKDLEKTLKALNPDI